MNLWKRTKAFLFSEECHINTVRHQLDGFKQRLEDALVIADNDPQSACLVVQATEWHARLKSFESELRSLDDGRYTSLLHQLHSLDYCIRHAECATSPECMKRSITLVIRRIERLQLAA